MLLLEYTSRFEKDVKRLAKKRANLAELRNVIRLIEVDSEESLSELRRHHRMHQLKGAWADANECHIANAGDWLLVWQVDGGVAVLLRTGTHQDIFK
ncbi:type II toxin-antitoxin system YafQ family toxin [Actinomycetaceae bacterium MB13-C1-2]|nr:type II toxin-antitoxin system YafQ family toxin [Actinomycetaceae bacterium MB13-C1-2]